MDFEHSLPEWENEGTEPSASLKQSGFKGGYRPPAAVFNWFWSKVIKAITELQTKLGNHTHAQSEVTGLTTALAGKSDTSHTHKYAGSSSAGGAATSANKLNTNAGSATNPVYFANGVPVKTTYTLGKSVPSDAKFTDTTYSAASTSAAGLMSASDKSKLDGIASGANAYTLPAATSSALGGVKSGTDITVDSSGNVSVKDDSHNHVISNVDGLQDALDGKSNTGHTHNYAGSASAGGAATSANKLNTDAGSATNPVYFANGVPVKTTYTLAKSVPSDAKFTDTTYGAASTSADGLMSAADKSKLDGIATGANAYTHPTSHPASMITGLATVATSGKVSDLSGTTAVSKGGTGKTTLTSGSYLVGNGTSAVALKTPAEVLANIKAADETLSNVESNYIFERVMALQFSQKNIVSASSTDGVAYVAWVNETFESLEAGMVVTILPSMTATSTTPTLNVNGLGAIQIRRKMSSGTLTRPAIQYANVVYKDVPLHLMYDGTYWVATQFTKPSATDLYGNVPVQNGGWYINSSTTAEDKAEALEALQEIGVAPAYTSSTTDLTAGSSALETGKLYFVYQ